VSSTTARQVLVIGGTGFLGRRITEEFVRHADRVAVLSRAQQTRQGMPGTESIQADRRDPAALRSALGNREFDVVVDNIAFDAADVNGLLQVLNGRAGHYLLTSSVAVYTDRYVRRPLREDAADLNLRVPVDAPDAFHPRLGHAYGNGKRQAEQAIRESAIPWTVLRPPVVVGADDRTLRVWWFVQRLLDGQPLVIPDWGPGRVFQVVWTHDVARAFHCAASNPAAFGRTYNVAQAEVFTAESWIEAAAGRPFGHVLLDISAIRCELGFDPSPEAVWLQDTLAGCAANPPSVGSAGYERRDYEARVARTLLQSLH